MVQQVYDQQQQLALAAQMGGRQKQRGRGTAIRPPAAAQRGVQDRREGGGAKAAEQKQEGRIVVASGYGRLEHLKPQTMKLSQVGGKLFGNDGLNTEMAEGGRPTMWERSRNW
jgi:hypothetical protein